MSPLTASAPPNEAFQQTARVRHPCSRLASVSLSQHLPAWTLGAAAIEAEALVSVGLFAWLFQRKGVQDAVDAVAELGALGVDSQLDVVGSVFPGYEWVEDDLRARAAASRRLARTNVMWLGHSHSLELKYAPASSNVSPRAAGHDAARAASSADRPIPARLSPPRLGLPRPNPDA